MGELTEIMLAPFVACLVLTGIHAYLGLHVLEREVIFVDLALAQVAAFGATCGFFFGFALHSIQSYLLSLGATLLAALIISRLRSDRSKVPQEAYIGILYAVFAAGAIIVLSLGPEGGEELKNLLIGHLLYVDWEEIRTILLIYGVLAFVHWRYRRQFLQVSSDPTALQVRGESAALWDFLFYASLGVVVTSSVELAGVLVVFSFLIVPAVCGKLIAETVQGRLIAGWAIGVLASVLGMIASYCFDLPTGATVVCTFGMILVVVRLLYGAGSSGEGHRLDSSIF